MVFVGLVARACSGYGGGVSGEQGVDPSGGAHLAGTCSSESAHET